MSYKANLGVLIAQVRKDHPTLSCRAMYHKIEPQGSGRDRFERLCFELGYYIEKKINDRNTTDSIGVYRFDNLLEHVILTDINQAFSSDITYFEIRDRFFYHLCDRLFLKTNNRLEYFKKFNNRGDHISSIEDEY